MKIFVCHHKKYSHCFSDILCPIHVGKALSKTDLGFIGDDTQDNISEKNPYFCELTATYWIWKNVKDDVVGLYHYRRYFNLKNGIERLPKVTKNFPRQIGNTLKVIESLLKDYDIILPQKLEDKKYPNTLYNFYKKVHIISDLNCVLDVIKEKYPKQHETAYNILCSKTSGYYSKMLIAKKAVFDSYAQWLFSILFEVEKRIQKEVEKRDAYQKRVYGFLAERLMTVYIALHPELVVKEVPCVFIEEDKKKWRKYIFRYWKRKILAMFGIKRRENG